MLDFESDVKEIKLDLKELTKQAIEHNVLLKQHEARSMALQAGQEKQEVRLRPVEDHVRMVNWGAKLILGLLSTVLIGILAKTLIQLI